MKTFSTTYRVIYADIDAMGIVYHSNYIDMFERARTEMLRQMGYPYAQLEKIPFWLPCTEVSCAYKSPGRYDDLLEIVCIPAGITYVTVKLQYEVRRAETGDLLVTGHTVHAFTDDSLKPVRAKKLVPELYELMRRVVIENQKDISAAPE